MISFRTGAECRAVREDFRLFSTSNIDVLRITDNDDDTVDDEILLVTRRSRGEKKLTYPFQDGVSVETRSVCI